MQEFYKHTVISQVQRYTLYMQIMSKSISSRGSTCNICTTKCIPICTKYSKTSCQKICKKYEFIRRRCSFPRLIFPVWRNFGHVCQTGRKIRRLNRSAVPQSYMQFFFSSVIFTEWCRVAAGDGATRLPVAGPGTGSRRRQCRPGSANSSRQRSLPPCDDRLVTPGQSEPWMTHI
jgi:hypothetical protein